MTKHFHSMTLAFPSHSVGHPSLSAKIVFLLCVSLNLLLWEDFRFHFFPWQRRRKGQIVCYRISTFCRKLALSTWQNLLKQLFLSLVHNRAHVFCSVWNGISALSMYVQPARRKCVKHDSRYFRLTATELNILAALQQSGRAWGKKFQNSKIKKMF